ncbi:hypothetical protein [Massilia sp. TWR1-2-2]|uniref:hypothetical protein n=1 Tax=Massilia sp. TWR1-2-2 TaxID=2804584 RepID=UPI003CE7F1A4
MDTVIQEKVLAVARAARNREESVAWFRVALGLYYLAGLMTSDTIDFKQVDRDYNRFIYQSLGGGHSIASALQFMSGEKVVAVVDSPRFVGVFAEHCPEVPVDTIGFLLSLNLGVAKDISKLDIGGPVLDWIERQKASAKPAENPAVQRGDPAASGTL